MLFESHLQETDATETPAHIGLGANLNSVFGTPPETLQKAMVALQEKGITVISVSPLYKTAPVPVSDDPWYHNQVIKVSATLNAHDL